MYDTISILRNGERHEARRFLRQDNSGRTFQTVFYDGSSRCDLVPYAQFASDDPAMNFAADRMLAAMVDATAARDEGPH